MTNKTKGVILLSATIAGSLTLGGCIGGMIAYTVLESKNPLEKKMLEIFNLVKNNWAYSLEVDDIDYFLSNCMISGLNYNQLDQYMEYSPTDEVSNIFNESKTYVFGLDVLPNNNGILINRVDDCDFYTQGIRKFDVFNSYKLDDNNEVKLTDFSDPYDFYQKYMLDIQNNKNNESKLTISTLNDKVVTGQKSITKKLNHRLVKDEIDSNNKHNLIIQIDLFSENLTNNVSSLISSSIKEKGNIDNLLLDLSSNPGGLTKEGRDLASLFLKKNTFLSMEENTAKNHKKENYTKQDGPFLEEQVKNIKILGSEKTASSSELFIQALVGNSRAQLYGETTYGKGIQQEVISFKDGSTFKYTTDFVYGPGLDENGNYIKNFSYHEKGIVPSNDKLIANIYSTFDNLSDISKINQTSDLTYYNHLKDDITKTLSIYYSDQLTEEVNPNSYTDLMLYFINENNLQSELPTSNYQEIKLTNKLFSYYTSLSVELINRLE